MVTQGHRKRHCSIEHIRLDIFTFHSKYASIYYRFRDIAALTHIGRKSLPSCIRRPRLTLLHWKLNCDRRIGRTSVFNAFRTAGRMRSVGCSYSVLTAAVIRLSASSLWLVEGRCGRTSGEIGSGGGGYAIQTAAVVRAGTGFRRCRITAGVVRTESRVNTIRTATIRHYIAVNWQQPYIPDLDALLAVSTATTLIFV